MVLNSLDMNSDSKVMETCQDIINISSDLEEGEINDASDLEEISDVSTEEEILLRQRIEILENYNTALEKSRIRPPIAGKHKQNKPRARSKIKSHERNVKVSKNEIIVIEDQKRHNFGKNKHDNRFHKVKKTFPCYQKVSSPRRASSKISKRRRSFRDKSSSSESDIDVTKRKRILREAIGRPCKNDQSSLKKRLTHMIKDSQNVHQSNEANELTHTVVTNEELSNCLNNNSVSINEAEKEVFQKSNDEISLVIDSKDSEAENPQSKVIECKDPVEGESSNNIDQTPSGDKRETNEEIAASSPDNCISEDDAELLRELALNSKSRRKPAPNVLQEVIVGTEKEKIKNKTEIISDIKEKEDVDSDTAELRIIALKSAESKKAIERKRQEKINRKKQNIKQNDVDNNIKEDKVICCVPEDDSRIETDKETDGDITELRIIALKSAMLKKAMERKRQQRVIRKKQNKKRKRKSFMSIFSDDGLDNDLSHRSNSDHTDTEAVNMDITRNNSDHNLLDDYYTPHDTPMNSEPLVHIDDYQVSLNHIENQPLQYIYNDYQYYDSNNYIFQPMRQTENLTIELGEKDNSSEVPRVDDFEEDEDILRAKLLHSISSNHSKTISPAFVETLAENNIPSQSDNNDADSSLIIKLGESDSGSDCETTKNLALMHQKLAQQTDFQRNLDMFLKSARSKVENRPKVDAKPKSHWNIKKHTPVAVRHLPKVDQLEYRQLVKRMSELEKLKTSRQEARQSNAVAQRSNLQVTITQADVAANDNSKRPPEKEVRIVEAPIVQKKLENRTVELPRTAQKQVEVENPPGKKASYPSDTEIQLELSRQKITNQMKVVERLESESKGLREKTETLAEQARAITASFRASRIALNNNERVLATAHRNLVRLRKQHHILMNKIKTSPKSKDNNLTITVQQNIIRNQNIVNKVIQDMKKTTTSSIKSLNVINSTVVSSNINISKISTNKTSSKNVSLIAQKKECVYIKTSNAKDKSSQHIPSTSVNEISEIDLVTSTKINNNSTVTNSTKEHISTKETIKTEKSEINIKKDLVIVNKKELINSEEMCPVEKENKNPLIENEIQRIKTNKEANISETISSQINSELSNKEKVELNKFNLDKETPQENLLSTVSNNITSVPQNIIEDILIQADVILPINANVNNSTNCCTANDETDNLINTPLRTTDAVKVEIVKVTEDSGGVKTKISDELLEKQTMEHSSAKEMLCLENQETKDDDYKSPLQVLKTNTWSDNSQAIFCPFEVGGSCKDPECKYFHPKS